MAIVDANLHPFISQFNWYRDSNGYPTLLRVDTQGVKRSVKMHHAILGFPPKGFVVDHKNCLTMDNRKENLRFCTQSQNAKHTPGWRNKKSSKFKGVFPRPGGKRWRVIITADKKRFHVGDFGSEKEAAEAYNNAAEKLFGEFAHLNDLSTACRGKNTKRRKS